MARVYIETTIPSAYFDTRASPKMRAWRASTRLWWKRFRSGYDLCTSRITLDELAEAPAERARRLVSLLDGVRVLEQPDGVVQVTEFYIRERLMPGDALGDAAHLAMCSVHGIEYLLTWNCRHLANANKFRHLAVLNARLGLSVPTITTPDQLVPPEASG